MTSIRIGVSLLALTMAACAGPGDASQAELLEPTGPDSTLRDEVSFASVPVLLLPPPWNENARLMVGRSYYAVSAHSGELTISLQASDVVHQAWEGRPAPPRTHQVRGRPALVLVNEGIHSVTWEENETSYVLEVECFRALEDEHCTENAFVLELANSLVEAP